MLSNSSEDSFAASSPNLTKSWAMDSSRDMMPPHGILFNGVCFFLPITGVGLAHPEGCTSLKSAAVIATGKWARQKQPSSKAQPHTGTQTI